MVQTKDVPSELSILIHAPLIADFQRIRFDHDQPGWLPATECYLLALMLVAGRVRNRSSLHKAIVCLKPKFSNSADNSSRR